MEDLVVLHLASVVVVGETVDGPILPLLVDVEDALGDMLEGSSSALSLKRVYICASFPVHVRCRTAYMRAKKVNHNSHYGFDRKGRAAHRHWAA